VVGVTDGVFTAKAIWNPQFMFGTRPVGLYVNGSRPLDNFSIKDLI